MKKRVAWMDGMRLLCAFLVIVNHTNSPIFIHSTPQNGTWWGSLFWYYLSKPAVPIFVMISGACLLPRLDSYRKNAWRVGRMALVWALVSLLYWLLLGVPCDSLWYLPFYMGLLLMLPLLQKLELSLSPTDKRYLVGMSFLLGAAWPLLAHYVPALALSSYLHVPMFSVWIGLFFLGHMVEQSGPVSRRAMLTAALVLAASLALSIGLTRVEYARGVQKYWFMDDRMNPSALTLLMALSMVVLMRGLLGTRSSGRLLTVLSGCSFGIYLMQEGVIAVSDAPIFLPLCSHMPALAAVVLWELLVFVLCLAVTLVLRQIPFVKKLI